MKIELSKEEIELLIRFLDEPEGAVTGYQEYTLFVDIQNKLKASL